MSIQFQSRDRRSNYKSYYRREETKYNRSGWCIGRALAFKAIGRGFAPRQRFVFFTRPGRQFINHISANPYRLAVSCLLSGLYDLQIERRRLIQPPEGDRLLYGVLHQPMNSRLNRRI